jgi:high-affinity Fe2+/Pb2+ permease
VSDSKSRITPLGIGLLVTLALCVGALFIPSRIVQTIAFLGIGIILLVIALDRLMSEGGWWAARRQWREEIERGNAEELWPEESEASEVRSRQGGDRLPGW